jgi:hypothetical protein
MLVRPYTEADLDTFKRIHADSKLDYKMPNLASPLFIVRTVIERAGRPTTLLAGKIDVETYLMTSGTAAERLEDIEAAQERFLADLWEKGIDNCYCGVPASVNRHFGKHMERLGWERGRPGWINWFRDTEPRAIIPRSNSLA